MYTQSVFREERLDILHALITRHPLGTLVTHGAAGLVADHIPFEIAPASDDAPFGVLRAHVARANPLWQTAGAVMVVFQGASAYVTPSLYEDKPITGKVVPTWNYAVAHAHGTLRAIEDPAWILAQLERMTERHESTLALPWLVSDAPPEFIDKLLGAIVGIEIAVQRIDGKWKMSQNRSHNDQATIAAAIGGSSSAAFSGQRSAA